jgi:hypothetical protein
MPGPNQITKRTIAGVTYWQLQHGTTLFKERQDESSHTLTFIADKVAWEDAAVLATRIKTAVEGNYIFNDRGHWATAELGYWDNRQEIAPGFTFTRRGGVWKAPPAGKGSYEERRRKSAIARFTTVCAQFGFVVPEGPNPWKPLVGGLTRQLVSAEIHRGGQSWSRRYPFQSYDQLRPSVICGYRTDFYAAVLAATDFPQHRKVANQLGSTSPTVKRELRHAVACTLARYLNQGDTP